MTPAIFLDRDGTLIVEKHHLADPAGVELEPGVVGGLERLARHGLPFVVVTNQSGIGRGYHSEDAARAVNARVAELLAEQGLAVAGWYLCPHAPEVACRCRKPRPGMAEDAARDLGLTLPGSIVIGDKRADVELAHAIGGTGILVTTGHGAADLAWADGAGVPVAADLGEAAAIVDRLLAQRTPA